MCLSGISSRLPLRLLVRQEMATRKIKWTSKADNGRKFRGQPSDRQQTDVRRQFKKPRQSGADEVLQTDAVAGRGTGVNKDDFWYIESSSTDMMPSEEVRETVEVVMEREDSEDSEDDCIPIAQTRHKTKVIVVAEDEVSSEDATQMPEKGVLMTPKLGLLGIGTEVMRQFDEGLFVGTAQSYDRKTDLYKILYSNGDGEDMDQEEYIYAYQLATANGGDANDLSSRDSADEESAYQLPKQVSFAPTLHRYNFYASISLWPYYLQDKPARTKRTIRIRASKPSKAKATKLEVRQLCNLPSLLPC